MKMLTLWAQPSELVVVVVSHPLSQTLFWLSLHSVDLLACHTIFAREAIVSRPIGWYLIG